MEPRYYVLHAKKGYEHVEEACNHILHTFELSGVFSEALMSRIYKHTLLIQNSMENNDQNEAIKQQDEFIKLLDTYNIFSDKFKTSIRVLIYSATTKR
jgi:hypothetical protein